jgi:hypothetical protein
VSVLTFSVGYSEAYTYVYLSRYLIGDQSSEAWIRAEKQVADFVQAGAKKHGKHSLVSIKGVVGDTKRKADDNDPRGPQKKPAKSSKRGGR